MADLEKTKEIVDLNLLEQGLISVWYDNTGYLCEAIWVKGLTYFTSCEHKEVLPMVDLKENLCGFMIHGVEWISDGLDGYVTVNLKSDLPIKTNDIDLNGQRKNSAARAYRHNPIEQGIIQVRFDREAHYCEVVWGDSGISFAPTESEFILALVDADGVLCGFRVINTDCLAKNPEGMVSAELKTRTTANIA